VGGGPEVGSGIGVGVGVGVAVVVAVAVEVSVGRGLLVGIVVDVGSGTLVAVALAVGGGVAVTAATAVAVTAGEGRDTAGNVQAKVAVRQITIVTNCRVFTWTSTSDQKRNSASTGDLCSSVNPNPFQRHTSTCVLPPPV
jgi:hypothetical protein